MGVKGEMTCDALSNANSDFLDKKEDGSNLRWGIQVWTARTVWNGS